MVGVSRGRMTSKRQACIQALGEAVATRPLDRNAVQRAAQTLQDELGKEVLVEMAGVAGVYECFTKFVDATGVEPPSPTLMSVMGAVLGVVNWTYSWFY